VPELPLSLQSKATIIFNLPKASQVTLKIYNILGEEVATLVFGKSPVGEYKCDWQPKKLASGIYLYQLEAGDFKEVKKLIFLK
jgi:hypothetical protein